MYSNSAFGPAKARLNNQEEMLDGDPLAITYPVVITSPPCLVSMGKQPSIQSTLLEKLRYLVSCMQLAA